MTRKTVESHNLVSSPWILVIDIDGAIREASLQDVFVNAHRYRRLGGEVPTQSAAVLRLLLAVLRRAHRQARTVTDWKLLWEQGHLESGPIDDYLRQHRERFDLLHSETPFFQIAGLHTAKGEMTELARLIADVPNGRQYFSTRAGDAVTAMSYSEAARWLVHAHAFDCSGIKSGAVGDDRVKRGKGYPIGTGWCGWLGMVIVEGANLFESLMLNLPLDRSWAESDLPVWERPPQGPSVELRPHAPTGPADLLTWQSRRVRLDHDGERVTGVLIANGDPLDPRDQFRAETMTSWRRSEAQEKALKSAGPVYMPRAHMPDRAVWRGLEGLLVETDISTSTMAGKWIEWLGQLKHEEILPPSYPLRLRAVGMHYGAKSSVIDDITDDVLPLSLAVLTEPQLKALAIGAVADVNAAVGVLGQFADELSRASGAGDLAASHRAEARELGYAALDGPYRTWVRTLSVGTDQDVARVAWQQRVRTQLVAVMRQLLDSASDSAWSGILIKNKNGDRPLNAATATNWFYFNLAKALPLTRRPAEGQAS